MEKLMVPPGEARVTRRGHVAGSTYPPAAQDRSIEQPPRRLQDDGSCAVGGDFTVSSTIYSAANGCYFTFVPDDPYTFVSTSSFSVTVGDRLVLPSSSLFTDDLPVSSVGVGGCVEEGIC